MPYGVVFVSFWGMKRRKTVSILLFLAIGVAVVAFYSIDGPLRVPSELERPIPRDPEAAARLEALMSIKLEAVRDSLPDEESEELSNLAVQRTLTDEDVEILEASVALDATALAAIEEHLRSGDSLRFPEYTAYDFAVRHKVDGVWVLPELLVRSSAIARAKGNFSDALDLALDGLRLASAFGSAGGVVIHSLLAETGRYRSLVAIERVFASADSGPIDRAVMEKLKNPNLHVSVDALEETLLSEFQWSLAVSGQAAKAENNYDQLRKFGMLPKPDSFVWKFPKPFLKHNRTQNLYADLSGELLENLRVPIRDRSWLVGDELSVFATEYNPWHPNSIGRLQANQSYVLFELTFDKHLRSNLFADALCVAAAIRLFESSHGRLPDTLDELCPEYIGLVPRDFADNGPLRYDPVERIVYAIGFDWTDDGGSRANDLPFDSGDSDDLVLEIPGRAGTSP